MAANEPTEGSGEIHAFGSCCGELREAMSGDQFEPLISVGDDGILYMSVGLIELDDEEAGMVDHPVLFCPFCGAELQSADKVHAATVGENGPN